MVISSNDRVGRAGSASPAATPDSHAREALERSLRARLLSCNHDELRVLDSLLERLELGRDRYGHLDLAKARDWDRELAEELLDVAVYRAVLDVRRQDVDRLELRRASAVEIGLAELERNAP